MITTLPCFLKSLTPKKTNCNQASSAFRKHFCFICAAFVFRSVHMIQSHTLRIVLGSIGKIKVHLVYQISILLFFICSKKIYRKPFSGKWSSLFVMKRQFDNQVISVTWKICQVLLRHFLLPCSLTCRRFSHPDNNFLQTFSRAHHNYAMIDQLSQSSCH